MEGGGSPDFPEVGAGSFVQCGAFVLTLAAHVVQVDTPLVEHLSSSESDMGKAGCEQTPDRCTRSGRQHVGLSSPHAVQRVQCTQSMDD